MSKLIREIALQASGGNHYLHTHGEPLQKFAEMLIKEALEVARAGVEFGDGMESAVERYFEIKL